MGGKKTDFDLDARKSVFKAVGRVLFVGGIVIHFLRKNAKY